jgi:hypothetical protein
MLGGGNGREGLRAFIETPPEIQHAGNGVKQQIQSHGFNDVAIVQPGRVSRVVTFIGVG